RPRLPEDGGEPTVLTKVAPMVVRPVRLRPGALNEPTGVRAIKGAAGTKHPAGVGGKPLLLRQWLPMTVKHPAGVGGKGRRSVPSLASQEEYLADLRGHHANAALLTCENTTHTEVPELRYHQGNAGPGGSTTGVTPGVRDGCAPPVRVGGPPVIGLWPITAQGATSCGHHAHNYPGRRPLSCQSETSEGGR